MTNQLLLFTNQSKPAPAQERDDAGSRPPAASAAGGLPDKPMTPRSRLKYWREELRYAQMQVRLDIASLARAKAKARRIAAEMRKAQAEL